MAALILLSSCQNTPSPNGKLTSTHLFKSLIVKIKGGMNLILQVDIMYLVQDLAGPNGNTPDFTYALALAQHRSIEDSRDFITIFAEAWKEISKGAPLSQVFCTVDLKGKITPETSDADVISIIQDEAENVISNTFNVIKNRIDCFGATLLNIQKLGNDGRILVELTGVKDPERVMKLLQRMAYLEFWDTYFYADVRDRLETINANENGMLYPSPVNRPQTNNYACIGNYHFSDTAKINNILKKDEVKKILKDLKPMWSVKPNKNTDLFELVAIRMTHDGKAKLDGDDVADASVQFENTSGSPQVSMTMTSKGASTWKRITRDASQNKNQIAIVLDGMVYSYPTVQDEIGGGQSQITGDFTIEEAEDLANVLKSGKFLVPVRVIWYQLLQPSL